MANKKKIVKLDLWIHESFDTEQYLIARYLSEVDPVYRDEYVKVTCELHVPIPEKKVELTKSQFMEIRDRHVDKYASGTDFWNAFTKELFRY